MTTLITQNDVGNFLGFIYADAPQFITDVGFFPADLQSMCWQMSTAALTVLANKCTQPGAGAALLAVAASPWALNLQAKAGFNPALGVSIYPMAAPCT